MWSNLSQFYELVLNKSYTVITWVSVAGVNLVAGAHLGHAQYGQRHGLADVHAHGQLRHERARVQVDVVVVHADAPYQQFLVRQVKPNHFVGLHVDRYHELVRIPSPGNTLRREISPSTNVIIPAGEPTFLSLLTAEDVTKHV